MCVFRGVNTNDSVMKPEEDSPFFYRCHLKASRRKGDGESESGSQLHSGQSSYSSEIEIDGGDRLDASSHPERNAPGGFDGD